MNFKYYEKGKGENLLFLGGAGSTIDINQPFLDGLSKYYHVYFFNYPGFKGTDKFKSGHTLGNYLGAINEFASFKSLTNFHLAGMSLGGYLSTCYARKNPNMVQSLILFSPLTRSTSQSFVLMLAKTVWSNFQKFSRTKEALTKNVLPFRFVHHLVEKTKQGRFAIRSQMTEDDIPKQLPILVILGEKDRIVDFNCSLAIFKTRKNVEIKIMPNCGHEAFATIGTEIYKIVTAFTGGNRNG